MSGGVFVVVSARMASSRYPGKALVPLAGRPLVGVLLERMAHARGVDGVVLATSEGKENNVLEDLARREGFEVFRGDEEDVLKRHVECARHFGARHVVRVTGDNPLTDIETLESLLALHLKKGADYTYVPGEALLMGILSEVVATKALEASWQRGEKRHRSELVTLYIKEHPEEFHIETAELSPALLRPGFRLTVDEKEDVALLQILFARLAAPGKIVTTREAIALMESEPELPLMNAHLRHKAGNLRSVALDQGIVGGS